MKRLLTVLLLIPLTLISSTIPAVAGSRYHQYHDYGYRPYVHHHAPYRYRYHRDAWLPWLGVGLLTGAMVSTMVTPPPPPRTVYYPAQPVTIYSPQVTTQAPTTQAPEMVLRQVTITEKLVNVRSGPGLDTNVVGRAVAGEVLDVIGAAPEWLYIRTTSGQYGWVMSRYTSETASPVG